MLAIFLLNPAHGTTSSRSFTHYGGVCVNAEYSHEVVRLAFTLSVSLPSLISVLSQALRLVLNSLATTAAKYGRYIEPQLSLSIDFYVRLFIRVKTGPKEVKALPSCVFSFLTQLSNY